jgi:hypothetical protein
MDIHPSGDHLIVGGYDRKLCWFDLELSDKPYKILRFVKNLSTFPLCMLTLGLPQGIIPVPSARFNSTLPTHYSPHRRMMEPSKYFTPEFITT